MSNTSDNSSNRIDIINQDNRTPKHIADIAHLQSICFPEIDNTEANEDFYHPESAHVLAYNNDQLVGWAGIHTTNTTFDNNNIKIGGYGICVHPDHRQQGIAQYMVQSAVDYLKDQQCHIGFLSSGDDNQAAVRLHQKFGFVRLKQSFTWINSKGELESDSDGMIAPLSSPQIFNLIYRSSTPLHVGHGYW